MTTLPESSLCVCGEPATEGVIHRTDGPCYMAEREPVVRRPDAADDLDVEFDVTPRGWTGFGAPIMAKVFAELMMEHDVRRLTVTRGKLIALVTVKGRTIEMQDRVNALRALVERESPWKPKKD